MNDGQLSEEPQSERGVPGSRDTGSDRPAGGPADRPVGSSGADADTSVDPPDPVDPDMPNLRSGDQGG